jgi:hypothetical protein
MWLAGQRAAERRANELRVAEGAMPECSVSESLAAINAAYDMGLWPGPRDPISEAAVERVRRRWAQVQNRAKLERYG